MFNLEEIKNSCLADLLEQLPFGLILIQHRRVVYLNQALRNILGFSDKASEQRKFFGEGCLLDNLFHPEEREKLGQAPSLQGGKVTLRLLNSQGAFQSLDFRHYFSNSTSLLINLPLHHFWAEDSWPIFIQHLFHQLQEPILLLRPDKILACNPKAASFFGLPVSELLNQDPDYFLEGLDEEQLKALSDTAKYHGLINLRIKSKEWSAQPTPARVNLLRLGNDYLYLINFSTAGLNESKQEMEQKMYELRSVYHGILTALNRVIEIKDPYNARHHQRVSNLARALATVMKLPRENIEAVRVSASIHDIGKLMVPAEIIAKPGQLNPNEQNLMRLHPEAGHDILKTISFPWPVADIVLQHHERWDGSGYPQGLSGHQILLEARILAVADVVEAIVSHRPYRPALSLQEALNELEENKGILYDPQVVEACLFLFRRLGYSFENKDWIPNLLSYLKNSSC